MSNNGKPVLSISHPVFAATLQDPIVDGFRTNDLLLQLVRWQVVTAFNIISEAAIFGMSIFLVFGLRMPLSQKSVVVTAFGMRLP